MLSYYHHISSIWHYPSPWSVSSLFLTSSRPLRQLFITTLLLICECRLLASRRQSRPSARRNFTRPVTYRKVCTFSSLIPYTVRVTLHAPDAWQMKKNFSRRSRASFGAFLQ